MRTLFLICILGLGASRGGAASSPYNLGEPINHHWFLVGAPFSISKVGSRLVLKGNTVYVADGEYGLAIYDISDGGTPRRIGTYPTASPALEVRLSPAYAWVRTQDGLVLLDIRKPDAIQPVPDADWFSLRAELDGTRPNDAITAVVGNRAYISRADIGVVEIPLRGMVLPRLPSVAALDGADMTSSEVAHTGSTRGLAKTFTPDSTRLVAKTFTPDGGSAQESTLNPDAANEAPTPLFVDSIVYPQPLGLAGQVDSGVFRLTISGTAGQTVRVQRSFAPNEGWEDWITVTLGAEPVEVTDPIRADADQVFYRAVAP